MTRIAVLIAASAALSAFGCSNATRYTRGPQPVASSPDPTWALVSPPSLSNTFTNQSNLLIKGKLKEVRQTDGPDFGLLIHLTDADFGLDEPVKSAVISIKTWKPGVPDLKAGDDISINVSNRRNNEIMISDGEGPALRSWVGEALPPNSAISDEYPLHITASVEPGYSNAYTEVIQSEDLCRQTWVHSRLSVTSDCSQVMMSAGQSATLTGSSHGIMRVWLITAADDRWLDESSCAEDKTGSAFFTWIRIGRDDALGNKQLKMIKKLRN